MHMDKAGPHPPPANRDQDVLLVAKRTASEEQDIASDSKRTKIFHVHEGLSGPHVQLAATTRRVSFPDKVRYSRIVSYILRDVLISFKACSYRRTKWRDRIPSCQQ